MQRRTNLIAILSGLACLASLTMSVLAVPSVAHAKPAVSGGCWTNLDVSNGSTQQFNNMMSDLDHTKSGCGAGEAADFALYLPDRRQVLAHYP